MMFFRVVTASALLALGCGAGARLPRGAMPKAARRDSPPPGIDESALAVGANARPFSLVSSGGGSWSLREALAEKPVMALFYRGFW